jgi:ubiquinone/menaquinone biosynthesis C-methylase UbiE
MSEIVWKRLAPVYTLMRQNPFSAAFLRGETKAIYSLMDALPWSDFASICDIGVGRGHSLRFMPGNAKLKIAIDFCQNMLFLTAGNYPGIRFIQADAQSLPFSAEKLDLITCIGVLEYITLAPLFL